MVVRQGRMRSYRLGLSGWLLREEGEEKSRKLKADHNHGRPVNALIEVQVFGVL
jgi:hypothetical protein